MEGDPLAAHVDHIVGRNSLYFQIPNDLHISIFQYKSFFDPVRALFGQHHQALLRADQLKRFKIKVIAVIVGQQDNIGLGHF